MIKQLIAAHASVEARVGGQVAELGAYRVVVPRIASQHRCRTLVGTQQTDNDAHRRRLASTVWTEETTDLTRPDFKVDAAERGVTTKAFRDPFEANNRFHQHIMHRRGAPRVSRPR